MADEISLSGAEDAPQAPEARHFMPIRIGNVTAYVEGQPGAVVVDEGIRPVAPADPAEAFGRGLDMVRECVRVIGEKFGTIAEAARPEQVTVEFSLGFEIEGRAALIPVLLTGRSGVRSALTVTAVWRPGDRPGQV